ncbi:MAG: DJ-1/PfpI family protein [Nanobdellota archaeon]
MRILYISPNESFPDDSKKTIESILKNKNVELEHIQKIDSQKNASGYSGVILAGDEKVMELDLDPLKDLLYEMMKEEKVVAAIDAAPVSLAMAGILTGKCSTVNDANGLGRQLHKLGGMFFDESVVVDRNIITSNSPSAAEEFANTVIELLESNKLDNRITCN